MMPTLPTCAVVCFLSKARISGAQRQKHFFLPMQDPLKGSPETSLTAIGLRSGDIVWIISPTPAPTQQDPPAAIAPHTSSVKDSSRCDYGDTSSSRREPNSPRAPESGPSAGDPLPMEVENCTQQPLLQFPGHFKRVLASNLDTEYAKTPCGILILLVHAVMLETGFTFVSPAHEKQKDAFSTQPEECDASLKIYKKNMQNNRQYFVPNSCAATMGVTVLTYALPHSIAAGKQSTQRDPDSIRRSIKALAPGPKGEEDINDTEESSDAPKISIHCSRIGGTGMVILGNLNNKASDNAKAQHTQKVLLNALDYFHKTDSSSNTSLDMQMDSGFFHLTVDSIDMMFSMASARGLWNELKDHLALPLLRAACEASGLPSPAHLLSLPGEIKWRILLLLDPFDLSALGQVSSEWRHQVCVPSLRVFLSYHCCLCQSLLKLSVAFVHYCVCVCVCVTRAVVD